jgi:hypothetical protein
MKILCVLNHNCQIFHTFGTHRQGILFNIIQYWIKKIYKVVVEL